MLLEILFTSWRNTPYIELFTAPISKEVMDNNKVTVDGKNEIGKL